MPRKRRSAREPPAIPGVPWVQSRFPEGYISNKLVSSGRDADIDAAIGERLDRPETLWKQLVTSDPTEYPEPLPFVYDKRAFGADIGRLYKFCNK